VATFENLGPKASDFLRAHGFGPGRPPDGGFCIRYGLLNYARHPLAQARSLGLKLANLLRPSVLRRHLERFMPRPLTTVAFWVLFAAHAALVWLGLGLLFTRPAPAARVLQFMVLATVAVSLALWAEPRYLLPFYLPLFALSLEAWVSLARDCRKDHDSPPAVLAGPTRA
jgi:hypothetical protein